MNLAHEGGKICNRALSDWDSRRGKFSYYICRLLMNRGCGASSAQPPMLRGDGRRQDSVQWPHRGQHPRVDRYRLHNRGVQEKRRRIHTADRRSQPSSSCAKCKGLPVLGADQHRQLGADRVAVRIGRLEYSHRACGLRGGDRGANMVSISLRMALHSGSAPVQDRSASSGPTSGPASGRGS